MRYLYIILAAALLCGCSADSADLASETMYVEEHAQEAPEPDQPAERRIIYTAHMTLVVNDFSGIVERVSRIVDEHEGYIASQNLERMQGERRSGNWMVRIPVDQFEPFLSALGKLGVPVSQNQDAQDVTEEFVDLQARIANKKKLEERILELLDRPDDQIQHVIEVEKELGRVREEIERMEGRLRYLQDRTAMTTVSLFVREEQNYLAPQTPALSNRVSSAWTNSVKNFSIFLQNLLVFLVGNAIGIVVFLVCFLLGILILKRIVRWLFRRPAAAQSGS